MTKSEREKLRKLCFKVVLSNYRLTDGELINALMHIPALLNDLEKAIESLKKISSGILPNGDHVDGAAIEFAEQTLSELGETEGGRG